MVQLTSFLESERRPMNAQELIEHLTEMANTLGVSLDAVDVFVYRENSSVMGMVREIEVTDNEDETISVTFKSSIPVSAVG